jgi:hypothetical protein
MLCNLCAPPAARTSARSSHRSGSPFETLEPRRLMSATTTLTTVDYQGGVQVRITGTDGDDQIIVRQDPVLGLVVTNTADSAMIAYGGPVTSVRVDGGAGNDVLLMHPQLALRTFLYGGAGDDMLIGGPNDDYLNGGAGANTLDGFDGEDVLVSVGGSVTDKLTGGYGRDSYWCDARKTEVTDYSSFNDIGLHRIPAFFSRVRLPGAKTALGNVSLATTDLADPAVTDYRMSYGNFADRPLFASSGPSANDVYQGAVGDCYLLAVLSSVAGLKPDRIEQSVCDLGDGTYVVHFRRGGNKFVRVDADLPAWNGTDVPAYAGLGRQHSMWVAVMEKAYVTLRSPQSTYAVLDGGWMREAYLALGMKSRSYVGNPTADVLVKVLEFELNSGKSVTYATVNTPAPGAPLLGNHAYYVVGLEYAPSGAVTGIRMRNPWGEDGAGGDGVDDGYVTVLPSHLAGSFLGYSSAAA